MDGFRMSQVFNNLIAIVLKFTKEGLVEVSVSRYEDYCIGIRKVPGVLITVRDTGIGIPEG
jgi:signal transduction histidine kinase